MRTKNRRRDSFPERSVVQGLDRGGPGFWRTGCKIDRVTDWATCYVARPDAGVTVFLEPLAVSVGLHRAPGSPVALRIDKRPPHLESSGGRFPSKEAQAIVREMKEGSTILARCQDWPEASNTDREAA